MKSLFGILVWVVLLIAVRLLQPEAATESKAPLSQISKFAFGSRQTVTLRLDPPQRVRIGDPIYLHGSKHRAGGKNHLR
ncbi:MAG: hypothetical protein R3C03_11415 [Pirellulaceae bacterium]